MGLKPKEEIVETATEVTGEELSPEELELFGNIQTEDKEDDGEEEEPDTEETAETEEPEDEGEPEETIKEEPKLTGQENWELEDYKKAYNNLQSKLGKQGQELGEARQQVSQPTNKNYTIEDVPEMEDDVLNIYLKAYEDELSDSTLEFTDEERFKTLSREYDALKEERTIRTAMARLNKKQAEKAVVTTKAEIQTKYGLSEEEITQVVNLAKRLSDEGIPTKEDLEAAVYRIKPAAIERAVTKKLNTRISEAKNKGTPRVPSGSSHEAPKTISVKEFSKMDELARERYLNECSVDEVNRLLAEID